MSSKTIKFIVKDRKDKVLASLDFNRDVFTIKMTVEDLIELLHKKVERLSKCTSEFDVLLFLIHCLL